MPRTLIRGIMGLGDAITSTKQEAHSLLDRLSEADLAVVARMLRGLVPADDPLIAFLASAPEDDDPHIEEEQRLDAESREACRRGEGIPHAEIGRRARTGGA
ncbi:MAG: hypothetical protein HY321_18515 [Armatimonadetes bacterium]|nr:hypothetical protein [Armatimonadota bacterium]